MATCPNKSHPDWNKLVEAKGEDMAYYLWNKYDGEVPDSEFPIKEETIPESSKQIYFSLGNWNIYQKEANNILRSERVYDRDPNIEDIARINRRLKRISDSIGDYTWTLRKSYAGNWYIAGYKGGNVLANNYSSPYARNIFGQINEVPASRASQETLKKIREVIAKMGIKMDTLQNYLKGNPDVNAKGASALADALRGIIAIAEGREDTALIEELIHIATSSLEQTNPQLITEMISKISNFKIYDRVLNTYKDNPNYQTKDGKPDIRKIKKEAVDKLIAELVIYNSEGSTEFPELMQEINRTQVRTWWQKILDAIRSLYKKANIDIFQQTAQEIMSGEVERVSGEGVFLQQVTNPQKKVQDSLMSTNSTSPVIGALRKVESQEKPSDIFMDTEEASNWYEVFTTDGWKKVKKRVTDRVKAYYKDKFPGKEGNFTDVEKRINEFKRTHGILYHAFMQEIHGRYFNKDGTRKDVVDEYVERTDEIEDRIYRDLERYFLKFIDTFKKEGQADPLVFSEIIIYDNNQKEAGTIDLLIVDKDGNAYIFDWKFMGLGYNQNDVLWYKQGAFDIQLSRYKQMLLSEYSVKKVIQARAIPIVMDIGKVELAGPDVVKGIRIGDVDVQKITDLTLLPVAVHNESTGNKTLDDVIGRINSLIAKIGQEDSTTDEEREYKSERLNALRRAVRIAQVTSEVIPIVDVISTMRKEGQYIINTYRTKYETKSIKASDITDQELSDFSDILREYQTMSTAFDKLHIEVDNLIYTPKMEEEATTEEERAEVAERKKILDKLILESRLIAKSAIEIKEIAKDFANRFVGWRNGEIHLLDPHSVIKGFTKFFRDVNDLGLASTNLLVKLSSKAKDRATQESLKKVDKLMEIRKRLSDKGVDMRSIVRKIYQLTPDNKLVNRLIYKYSKEFYTEVTNNAKVGRSVQWLEDNIDVQAYQIEADVILRNKEERYKWQYTPDEQDLEGLSQEDRNKAIDKANQLIERLIEQEKKKWDLYHPEFNGFDNYVIKRHPLEKWKSNEYKEIEKDADLLELFNFIHSVNNEASDIGYINNKIATTFLPYIRKGMAESLAWDFTLPPISNWSDALTIEQDAMGYGKYNQLSGEFENGLPKYFTQDITKEGQEFSEDLFKNLILYINHVQKYKYLSEVEGQLLLVKHIEEFKGHYTTSLTSEVRMENNEPEEQKNNEQNYKLFDIFMRAIFYDQKYPLDDSDVSINFGKAMNFMKAAVNRVAGRTVWEETDNPSPTSLMKSINALNRWFQYKALGFEFISGAINAFGSNIQVLSQAGNYFKGAEVLKNQGKILKGFTHGDEKDAFIQLLDIFMPLKDDPNYKRLKKAGMSSLTRGWSMSDAMMVFMHFPEQLLEKSVFLTLLQNSMIVDGKMVNIREYVKKQHQNRYKGSVKENEQRIEEEIENLKRTKSMYITKKLVNGKIEVPGFDMTNKEEINRLTNLSRELARKATGNMSANNINWANLNIWTKSAMLFKNWIYPLYTTRFGEFRKVADNFSVEVTDEGLTEGEKYDIGRVRMLLHVIGNQIRDKAGNITDILQANEKGIEAMDKLFMDYAAEYKKRTGRNLEMNREEFYDMIRINLKNQMRELTLLLSLLGIALSMKFMAPDDDDDSRADKNFYRFWQRTIDRFIQELSFYYSPSQFYDLLSGSAFPALGVIGDVKKATNHFMMQTTGFDISNPMLSQEEVREKAQPIKNIAKVFPFTKSLMTYGAIFSEDWAREFDITIQKETRK